MIGVARKGECCGCAACASACPAGCIEMRADSEGFAYPEVDAGSCLECGRCERTCPFLGAGGGAPVIAAFAARTLDPGLLLASSSGGVFTELCRPVLGAGGAVYGVAMDPGCRGCSFARAEGMEGVAPMRGSKYLQADPRGVYGRVAADLVAGRRVLFSGTPCQANALDRYLGGRRDGLLLVDFICHGVPSPRLWAECAADLEARAGARMSSASFRCKEAGWRRFGIGADCGGRAVFQPLDESPYLRMFLRDACLRESCYECRAKETRAADVTIADFWGVEDVAPGMSDELGCSLAIVRTPAGASAFGGIRDSLESLEIAYDGAIRANPAVSMSAARPPERDAFFADLDAMGYGGVVRKYGRPPARERARRLAKAALARAGLLGFAKKLRGGGARE